MRIVRDEVGQTLVLTALCLGVMLGFVALATDVGVMFHSRRNMQIAADSAAAAGALDYLYNGSTTTAKAAAQSASSSNNFTNGTNGAVVTVNIPRFERSEHRIRGLCRSHRESADQHWLHALLRYQLSRCVRPGCGWNANCRNSLHMA